MRLSAMFTKGSKWLRSQEAWSFTPQQSHYQQQVQDLLCASSFRTLIMKLMFQHPSGKGKCIWGAMLVVWAAFFFLFSGNLIPSSCSFKITSQNYCPFLWRAETWTELSTKTCTWMRNISLNQAIVLVGVFFWAERVSVFGRFFFPSEINCRYV